MSQQGLAQNDQKCQFQAKFVFGQKILIFTGESKSFGTHITEKPPRQLVRINFWWGIVRNRPKMPIFDPKIHNFDRIWPFWAKNINSYGRKKNFGTHVTEKPPRHLVRLVFWSAMGPNRPKMPILAKKPILGQIWQLWAKIPNFYGSK